MAHVVTARPVPTTTEAVGQKAVATVRRWGHEKRARVRAFGNAMQTVVRKAAMNTVTGAQGGYLVTQQLQLAFDEGLVDPGIFRNRAYRQPMESREVRVAGLDLTASHAAGTSPVTGGVALTWGAESATINQTTPSFQGPVLVARNLEGIVPVSKQLYMDGGEALGAFLLATLAAAVHWFVEYACFRGTGVLMPRGIIGSQASATVNRTTANHVGKPDVTGVMASLLPGCFPRAIWCCSPGALIDLAQIDSYSTIYNPEDPRLCGMLFGRPLYVTEALPALGTRGDVVLFDPGTYVLGEHRIEIDSTDQEPSAFKNNQVLYRVIWRGDGFPLARGTVTLADGSTTAGTIVELN